jgi:hypothetical protein
MDLDDSSSEMDIYDFNSPLVRTGPLSNEEAVTSSNARVSDVPPYIIVC